MNKLKFLVAMLLTAGCSTNQKSSKTDAGFYNQSNYYFDTVKNKGYYIDSLTMPTSLFASLDVTDFLENKFCDFYIIFLKQFFFHDQTMIASIRSLDSNYINFLSTTSIKYKTENAMQS